MPLRGASDHQHFRSAQGEGANFVHAIVHAMEPAAVPRTRQELPRFAPIGGAQDVGARHQRFVAPIRFILNRAVGYRKSDIVK